MKIVNKGTFAFEDSITQAAKLFPMYQVLNEDGEIVNPDLFPDVSDEKLVELMKVLIFGRTYDERVIILNRQGALGNYPPAGGQEASQLATTFALQDNDFLVPTYRDIPPLLLRGLTLEQAFLWYKGHIRSNQYPESITAFSPQVIVGGQMPHAAGVAFGKRLKGEKNVVLAFCGDGGSSQGDFYEGLNFAGVYNAPLITILQNNGYGISTPTSKQTKALTFAQKGVAAGIACIKVDGMDPLAMYSAVLKAREYAIENGPVLIEAYTYRLGPHTMSDDPTRYRSDEEVAEWQKKDPLIRLRKYLEKKGLWNETMEEETVEDVKRQIKEAMVNINKAEKQKISTFLEYMFEVPTQNIKEQIEIYKQREAE
ncbi:pyruvate dehydrogenase E1 component, alpha subunit [Gemella bergeri ATCC 700627]|uniref:Pyruvate dehydrogenase E1 component subunit alpha n=1 Tax=Gemella bergeri ATCC 700627 TaxID=1321820 RepID=U2QUD0_9BACL|nr:pyruvate dehydrogenase (acetyl-transferring) E1 component subunit alpha [Gemella bergeri]ERK59824.1 pyruvate dehydrogenase E1 component, alpha subunit [Gemella bergeri ATCC 700627]